jgi:hypothetical protein
MIRFILKRDGRDHSGREWEALETTTAEIPALEALLVRGGAGEDAWDQTQLVGIEVLLMGGGRESR